MMQTQAQVLADVLDYTRQRSLAYFEKLRHTDIYREFEVNGTKLNSAYWIMGHLPVTENYMLLRATGGEIVRFAWARPFGLGGSMPIENERVPLSEIEAVMQEVHAKAMQHIATIPDAQLQEPSTGGLQFGDGSIRDMIKHAIWHEGTHAGHLGWLCKLNGIKTM